MMVHLAPAWRWGYWHKEEGYGHGQIPSKSLILLGKMWFWGIGVLANGCVCVERYEMRLSKLACIDATPSQYSKTPIYGIKPLKYMGNVLARYWLIGTDTGG
jgi:hypothetical protein